MLDTAYPRHPDAAPHQDLRERARVALDAMRLAASTGVIVAFVSHLAGASHDLQVWLSLGLAGVVVGLRVARLI
jgi:hypothetical protein